MILNKDVYNFPSVPPNKQALSSRRPIYGVGVNDSEYTISAKINGKEVKCSIYADWHHMIERCYSSKYQLKHPTYHGCTVCDEWVSYSNFKDWWLKQADSTGLDLDKDIRYKGNKVYSPENCQYVSQEVNKLFTSRGAKRGAHPIGVTWHKRDKNFAAKVSHKGRTVHLGNFSTASEAHNAYRIAKNEVIKEVAGTQGEILKLEIMQHLYTIDPEKSIKTRKL